MIRGDGNGMMSIYSGVCQIYTPRHSLHLRYPCISIQPPLLLGDVLDRACLRCSWRCWSSELRDALGGRDWASLDMPWETEIEWTQRCTWRTWLCELGGRNRARLELHLEAEIEWDWTSTWRRPMDGALRLYSSISPLATVGMWQCDFTSEPSWRAGWWRSIM